MNEYWKSEQSKPGHRAVREILNPGLIRDESLVQDSGFSSSRTPFKNSNCPSVQKKEDAHPAAVPVSEFLLLLLLLGYEAVTSSPFRRDFLQSQNWATPNSCHSLLQEPTYAALTAPASSGNCREPGMGIESSHCSAIKRNHDHRTDPLTTHISKTPAAQMLTSFLQSTGLTLDSVFYLFCYGMRI